jgi:hypothetical protein
MIYRLILLVLLDKYATIVTIFEYRNNIKFLSVIFIDNLSIEEIICT